MFEQSILESSPRWKSGRGWATLASSSLQVLLLTLLVLVPVLRPDALSLRLRSLGPPLPLPYRPTARPQGPARSASGSGDASAPSLFAQPSEIPKGTYSGADLRRLISGADRSTAPDGVGCPTCPVGITGMNSVFALPPAVPRPAPPKSVTVSGGVIEGYLVRQVQPAYPSIAKLAGIQGDVVLQAVIGNDGSIQQLHAVSGHPWLIPSAMDAVRQWRYRPYRLNGQPVEVETEITVRFVLAVH